MAIATVNPTTGETVKTFDPLSTEEVHVKVGRAAEAFGRYRLTTFAQRAAWMRAAADILDREVDAVAAVMTTEMGKTLKAAKAEAQKCAKACRFYAEHAAAFLADEPADPSAVGAKRAFTRYLPIGPVLAVMPWNFPLWQAMRFAAPALMAGNVGLLKHASNVPQTALFMEDLFSRAGFPDGVFQTLLIGSDLVERVLRDPSVMAATLTGSTPAGQAVARVAAEVGVVSRCQNNGQSCISAKRFIVHEAVADEFERRFIERMAALRLGDPMDESTDLGPLATEQGRTDVEELVADAVDKGATVLIGGERSDGPGWFYPATVVTGITPEMRMFSEEVFGPVAQVHRVPGLDDALELANATAFGLGSNVWTNDAAEQERFVRDMDAGAVFVNGMTTSYPELPFGGVKTSGYGRELSAHGIREFCNIKAIWIG